MIRELFIAFVGLSLTVTVAVWFSGGPRLSVQQVEQIWLGEGSTPAATTAPLSLDKSALSVARYTDPRVVRLTCLIADSAGRGRWSHFIESALQ
jgi:hypothetical protein